MAEMLNHTRYSWNGVGSLGLMRRAFLEAASYAARRRSFGTTIDTFPMVRERLIWLYVDLAASTALTFHCAAALETATTDPGDTAAALRFRTLAPVVKYRTGEQNVDFARAAIETLGANGYVSDFGTPRLLRDAQVNPIWEGTSNICALDLQRAVLKQGGDEAVFADLAASLEHVSHGPVSDLAISARDTIAHAGQALAMLEQMPIARREQQARRVADLFGDAVALAAMVIEADFEARTGDYRKALTCDLFSSRRAQPADPLTTIRDSYVGVPESYESLFSDLPLHEAGYRDRRRALAASPR